MTKESRIMAVCDRGLRKLEQFPQQKWTPMDRICAALLAVCQILQHYEGPVFNAAITVLVVLVPYLGLRVLSKIRSCPRSAVVLVLATVLYQIYKVFNHGTSLTELGQSGVVAIYLLAAAMGTIDLKFLVKTATYVSMAAAVCLVAQYAGFYIFGTHLQMVPTGLLDPSAKQWILLAQTGQANIHGVMTESYRPSAFFLEPSHLYLYTFPHLCLTLFSGDFSKKNITAVLLISLALLLSTSGMGIAALGGAWVLFFALRNEKDGSFHVKNLLRRRNLIALGIAMLALVVVTLTVPFVQRIVFRIFTTGQDSSTAIGGRVNKALELLEKMSMRQWINGVSDFTHGIKFNIPGVISVLYRHGLIGLVLAYEFYTKSLWKLKFPYALVAALVLVTSCFSAHTHSTIGMLYFMFILLAGYLEQRSVAQKSDRK